MNKRLQQLRTEGERLPLPAMEPLSERERQLQLSLRLINRLLDSPHRTHVADGIREILQQRL